MKSKHSKAIAVCVVMTLYFAMYISFVLGYMKEKADDKEIRNLGISIDFYSRSTYWDTIGIGLFIIATMAAIGIFRYFRYKEPEKLNSLGLRNR